MRPEGRSLLERHVDVRPWRVTLAVLAPSFLAMAVAGCASPGSVRRVEEGSRLSQIRLAEVQQATDELRKELAAVRGQLEMVRRDLEQAVRDVDVRQREGLEEVGKRVAGSEKRLEALAGAVRGVEMSVGGLSDQVAKLEAVSTTTGAGAARREARVKPATRAPTPSMAADELFARAVEGFKNGELAQAILDFEDFLARNPSHTLAGTAQFLIGEAYYNARDYQHATVEYRKAVDMAPKGDKAPEALYKLGLAFRALKRQDRARDAWTQLINDFPQTEAAQRARLALREVSRAAKPGATADR
jgi:tol-pal system protein YbgF